MKESQETGTGRPEDDDAIADDSLITSNISRLKAEKCGLLTSIDLSNCKLSELPNDVVTLDSLQILIADQNLLTYLPANIGGLSKLRKMSLSQNSLSSLPNSFSSLHMLEVLDLSFNDLVSVSPLENGCAEIVSLDISHNLLVEWNAAPLCVRSLQRLDLSYNNLEGNPPWIWGMSCQSLTDLNLRNNNLRNPAHNIQCNQLWGSGVSKSLLSLNIANCGFSSKDWPLINQLNSLKVLNIGNKKDLITSSKSVKHCKNNFENTIWELSITPFSCKFSLCELTLSSLRLSFLPDEICFLEALRVLDCSFNELQWLPETISKLENLCVAVFSYNKLSYINDDIGMLTALEELWLDNNKIEDLPSSIGDLSKLCWLDLYGNCLDALPIGVKNLLPNLHGLDLGYNMFNLDIEEIGGFSNYEQVKCAMREHPQLGVMRSIDRSDEQQSKPEHIDSASSDESQEDAVSINSNCNSEEPGESRENLYVEEEVWDLKQEDEDDGFDPTCVSPRLMTYPLQHTSYLCDADTFCPGDAHAIPSTKTVKSAFEPNDGQFDDA